LHLWISKSDIGQQLRENNGHGAAAAGGGGGDVGTWNDTSA